MNILNGEVDFVFFMIVFGIVILFLIISQITRYVRISEYEKDIKTWLDLKGYTTDIFNNDIMQSHFDLNYKSRIAANAMIESKLTGCKSNE